ncbi:MAG: fibronectin-binding domain-containing protein [Erysipelotrichia bacterium]|nr:fibronectin-binding domain-containing protein [Erysipelotrichia bacterium]
MDYLTLRKHVGELSQVLAEKPLVARAADAPGRSFFLHLKYRDHWGELVISLDNPGQGMRSAKGCVEIEKSTSIVRTLNRLLTNGRLLEISMPGNEKEGRFDRVVKLHFAVVDSFFGRRTDYFMFCEFTGRIADVFICDAELKILDRLSRTSNNLIGATYRLPDSFNLLNPFIADSVALVKVFAAPREEWKNMLGGLSPQIESEIVFRATASSAVLKTLPEIFQQFIKEYQSSSETVVYCKNGKFKAMSNCELRHIAAKPDAVFPSVDAAMNWLETDLAEPQRVNILRKHVVDSFNRDLRQKNALLDEQKRLYEKYANACYYQNLGNLLVANLYRVAPGSRSIEIEDWQTSEMVLIELDPTRTPAANAQRYFNLYRKARRGSSEVEKRIETLTGEINWLREQIWLAGNATTEADLPIDEKLDHNKKNAKKQRDDSAKGRKNMLRNINPVLEIDGCRYYAGRNAKQNDLLTFQLARRGDYWFHANDVPGAHVILKKPEGEIEEVDLLRGAQLAALFSFARDSGKVAVDSTEVSFVKRIPGGAMGRVSYTHQKTILVDPADARHLLDRPE